MGRQRLVEKIAEQKQLCKKRKDELDKRTKQFSEGLITYDELGDYADMWFYESTYLSALKVALTLIDEED